MSRSKPMYSYEIGTFVTFSCNDRRISKYIPNIDGIKEKIHEFIKDCNRHKLSPDHFDDALDDLFNAE